MKDQQTEGSRGKPYQREKSAIVREVKSVMATAAFQIPPPEQFDFLNPESWRAWLKRFQRFRLASGLAEKEGETQVATLIYCMGEKSEDIFSSLNLTDANRKKFDEVSSAFTEHFTTKTNVIFERAKFNQRKQEEGETVERFVTELHRLAESCNFGPLREELMRDRLVVGLADATLSEKLQLDSQLTLKKAIDRARHYENVKRQQSELRNNFTQPKEEKVEAVKAKFGKPKAFKAKRSDATTRSSANNCPRCGKGNHSKQMCPAREAKCHKCS